MWNKLSSVFGNSPNPQQQTAAKSDAKGSADAKTTPPPKSTSAAPQPHASGAAGTGTPTSPPTPASGAKSSVVQKAASTARYLHKLKDYALLMEYRLLKQRAPSGVYVVPAVETLRRWHGVIILRHGLYRRGVFKFVIHIPEAYPYSAPRVYFLSKVFNPHINYKTGELDLTPQFPHWRSTEHYMELLLVYIKKVFYRSECWTYAPTAGASAPTSNTTGDTGAAATTIPETTTAPAPAPAAASAQAQPPAKQTTASILPLPLNFTGTASTQSSSTAPATTSSSSSASAAPGAINVAHPPASPIAVRGLHQSGVSPTTPHSPAPAVLPPPLTVAPPALVGTLPAGYQCFNKQAQQLWAENKREFLNCCEETVRWSNANKLLFDNRFDVHALNATIVASLPEAKRQSQLLLRQQQQQQQQQHAQHDTGGGAHHPLDDDDDQQCIGLSTNPISAMRFTAPQAAHQQILERILGGDGGHSHGHHSSSSGGASVRAAGGLEEGTSYIHWFLDGVQRLDSTPTAYKA